MAKYYSTNLQLRVFIVSLILAVPLLVISLLYLTGESSNSSEASIEPSYVPTQTVSKKGHVDDLAARAKRGKEFYVSPNPSGKGKGNEKHPWDLQTALTSSKVRPGDTIYLRGGTYHGAFKSTLSGTANAPITVRSYPGEWAIIDGHVATTLAFPISGTDTTLTLADGTHFPDFVDIKIDDERILIRDKVGASPASYSRVNRARGGTVGGPQHHAAGAEVILIKSEILTITGSWTIYRDFEITNSYAVRSFPRRGSGNAGTRGDGVGIRGPNNKLVNLVIHDTAGVGSWSGGDNSEVYGCILYNNGYTAPDRGHGHGIYIQTTADRMDTRMIRDVISFNNFATGMKAYSERGQTDRVHFIGVISFNNGSPHAVGPYGNPLIRDEGIFSGMRNGATPQKEVIVKECHLYHPPEVAGANLKIGYTAPNNEKAEITENFIIGGGQAFSAIGFRDVTFTGNIVYITPLSLPGASPLVFSLTAPLDARVKWNQNRIFNTALSDSRRHYTYRGTRDDFLWWKGQTAYDSNSSEAGNRPTGAWVFVRANEYEKGRAHIVVYNWDLHPTVDVDVSQVLQAGSSFEVRNVQDYLGAPVLSGVYNGGKLRLPLAGLKVAAPIGYGHTPQHTGPEFNVFVLLKR